jgi:uncharacterized protein
MSITKRSAILAATAIAISPMGFAQEPARPQNPVVHIEVLGADAPRLQQFYGEVFGWKVTTNAIGYGYVPVAPAAPTTLTGGIGSSPQKKPLVVFYIKVDDPGATLRRIEALGGRIVVPPTQVPGDITFAQFADPEGNIVGIVKRPN